MPVFIKYQYQIAGEADIKRSLTNVARHAEMENTRVLKTQARTRTATAAASSAANVNGSARAAEREWNERLKAEERATKKATAAAVKEHEKAEREKTRQTEREARERAKIEESWARKQRQLRDQHFRAQERQQRAEEAATVRARSRSHNTLRGVVGGTARTVSGIAGGALAVTGLGGTALAANALHGGMAAEKSALGLANQMAGAGDTKEQIRAKAAEITKRAQGVRGFSTEDVLGSARAFGGISGNYQLGLDMSDQLAQISLATDVNLEEISKVAGNAFMKLKTPGVSDKDAQEQTLEAVRAFAGQGNVGAVEIKDLAQYGGRLTAGAAKFKGTRLENMKQMGTLAQVAVGSGSATDAAEATEAAVRFADDLTTHADKFGNLSLKGKKISAFTDPGTGPGKNTQLRGIKELVADAIEATGGSQTMLGDIFGARSKKMTEAFASKYTEAEAANAALAPGQRQAKGVAGRAAIMAEFDKFDKAALSQKDQVIRAEAALAGTTAQVEEAMKAINSKLAGELLPLMPTLIGSLAQITPLLVNTVKSVTTITNWLAKNPFTGLSMLISGAIIKEIAAAKIGDVIRKLLTGGGGGGGGAPGGAGKVGDALTAISGGVATFGATTAVVGYLGGKRTEESAETTQSLTNLWLDYSKKQDEIMKGGGTDAEKAKALQELAGNTGANVKNTMDRQNGIMSNMPDWFRRVFDSATSQEAEKGAKEFQKQLAEDQAKAAKMLQDAATKLASGGNVTDPAVVPYRGTTPAVR